MARPRSHVVFSRPASLPAPPAPTASYGPLVAKQLAACGFSPHGAQVLAQAILALLGLANDDQAAAAGLRNLSLYDQGQLRRLQEGLRQGHAEAAALMRQAADLRADVSDLQALAQALEDVIDQALDRLMAQSAKFGVIRDEASRSTSSSSAAASRPRFTA